MTDDDEAFLSLTPIQDLDMAALSKEVKSVIVKPKITLEELQSKKAKVRAARYQEKQQQSGIVYVGRVPPSLGPGAVRDMLSQFGTILRVYFKPESARQLGQRRQEHKSSARRYECGWIEFSDKRHAKKCAVVLNGTSLKSTTNVRQVKDDIWMLQYLSKVKWDDLRQQHQHFGEVHNVRTTKALDESRTETAEFLRTYQQSKQIAVGQQLRESRLRRVEAKKNAAAGEGDGEGKQVAEPSGPKKRTASQVGFDTDLQPSRPPKPSGKEAGEVGNEKKPFRTLV